MGRNTSISLGDHFDSFIENSIHDGRYNNASEVIRAGLQLLEEERKVISLKKALNEGIASGRSVHFDPQKHLQILKARKKLNG